MRISIIQVGLDPNMTFGERIAAGCDEIASSDADVVILPELWATGYFNFGDYYGTAEPVPGPACRALGASAQRAHAFVYAGSLVERAADGSHHNTSLVFTPEGELVKTYRKIHLFGYGSSESTLLARGDEVVAYSSPFGVLGMTTCYDLRFPELFRALVDLGAEILVVVAAWPRSRLGHWRLLLQARAVENQSFVIGVNAAGRQQDVSLAGHSMVVSPWGEIVAEAGDEAERMSVEIDLNEVAQARESFPALADRRLGQYPAEVTG